MNSCVDTIRGEWHKRLGGRSIATAVTDTKVGGLLLSHKLSPVWKTIGVDRV